MFALKHDAGIGNLDRPGSLALRQLGVKGAAFVFVGVFLGEGVGHGRSQCK